MRVRQRTGVPKGRSGQCTHAPGQRRHTHQSPTMHANHLNLGAAQPCALQRSPSREPRSQIVVIISIDNEFRISRYRTCESVSESDYSSTDRVLSMARSGIGSGAKKGPRMGALDLR